MLFAPNPRLDTRQKGSFYFIRLKNTNQQELGGKMGKEIQRRAEQRSVMTKGEAGLLKSPNLRFLS